MVLAGCRDKGEVVVGRRILVSCIMVGGHGSRRRFAFWGGFWVHAEGEMDVWLEMWVDFVYWQWGGRAGVGGVRLVFVSDIHALSDVWSSDEGWEGGVVCLHGMAWHSDLYDCITVTVTC